MTIRTVLREYAPQVLVFLGCLVLILVWQMGLLSSPHPLLGKPAPPLRLETLEGDQVELSAHYGKEVVVLDFFATWCPPCREGLPVIARLAQAYAGQGVAVYAVNLKESSETVGAFLEEEGLDLRVMLDRRQEAAQAFEVGSVPHTVIIGKDGMIEAVHVGLALRMEQRLRDAVDALLQGEHLVPRP